jgi:Ser/Thr protein kinase RdoA (MazF antagonist)
VVELVAASYPIKVSGAALVRSFNNDVFCVHADSRDYALKLYGAGRFTADEVRWEQQLARHLVDAGVPVAADVPLRNGDSVGALDAPEGQRLFALTEWVPGAKPQPPWSDALYRAVGSLLAQLHEAADSFVSDYPRSAVRSGAEPGQVIAVLEDGSSRHLLVQRAAAAAQDALDRLASQGLRWAIRHGDPSLDNIHITQDGELHFYDLDLAGPGWQVEDLAGALSTSFAEPFLDGYVANRPLPAVDIEALPWLRMMSAIDNLKFHLIDKSAAMGVSTLSEGWVDRGFDALANAARDSGLDAPSVPDQAARLVGC